MNIELENKLAEKYSFMRNGESLESHQPEGFGYDLYDTLSCECGNGWYQLIDELCSSIQKTFEAENLPVDIEVIQIKEKYGFLQFDAIVKGSESIRAKIDRLISEAENRSDTICENCGKPGVMRDDHGWMSVRCDKCFSEEKSGNFS